MHNMYTISEKNTGSGRAGMYLLRDNILRVKYSPTASAMVVRIHLVAEQRGKIK